MRVGLAVISSAEYQRSIHQRKGLFKSLNSYSSLDLLRHRLYCPPANQPIDDVYTAGKRVFSTELSSNGACFSFCLFLVCRRQKLLVSLKGLNRNSSHLFRYFISSRSILFVLLSVSFLTFSRHDYLFY